MFARWPLISFFCFFFPFFLVLRSSLNEILINVPIKRYIFYEIQSKLSMIHISIKLRSISIYERWWAWWGWIDDISCEIVILKLLPFTQVSRGTSHHEGIFRVGFWSSAMNSIWMRHLKMAKLKQPQSWWRWGVKISQP